MNVKQNLEKKALIIINPQAGKSFLKLAFIERWFASSYAYRYQSKKTLQQCIQVQLESHGIQSQIKHYNSQQALNTLINQAQKKYDLLIAVGGDGTINDVIQKMVGKTLPLGIIPAGSANVLAHALDVSFDIKKACQRIALFKPKAMDVGSVNDRYFTCMAGIGFDAYVVYALNKRLKKLIGPLAYGLALLKALFSFKFDTFTMKLADKNISASSFIFHNCAQYGGKKELAKQANVFNQSLTISCFKTNTAFTFLKAIIHLLKGRSSNLLVQVNTSKIGYVKQKSHLQVDGEYLGYDEATIKIHKKALWIL